jgi:hypothetical protein
MYGREILAFLGLLSLFGFSRVFLISFGFGPSVIEHYWIYNLGTVEYSHV